MEEKERYEWIGYKRFELLDQKDIIIEKLKKELEIQKLVTNLFKKDASVRDRAFKDLVDENKKLKQENQQLKQSQKELAINELNKFDETITRNLFAKAKIGSFEECIYSYVLKLLERQIAKLKESGNGR